MTNQVLQHRKGWAAVIGAAALALASTPFVNQYLEALDDGLISDAYAQEHTGGAGGSGSHTEGGGSGTDTGHTGGGPPAGAGGGHEGGSGSEGGHTGGSGSTGGHEGGGCSGGGCGGGGGGGGHAGGAGGGGGHAGGGGGERHMHGTRPGHVGHASGSHDSTHSAGAHDTGEDRIFGGGSGLSGMAAVPEGVGRYGPSYGAGPPETSRFRYWGGWSIPDDPGDTDTYAGDTGDASAGGGGPSAGAGLFAAARCDDVGGGSVAQGQFGDRNLQRMTAVHELVAPEQAAKGQRPSPYLIANFQNELQKAKPDTLAAGTYLGLVAQQQVTPQMVKQVSWRLCGQVSEQQAMEIASVAETQRIAQSAPARVSEAASQGR